MKLSTRILTPLICLFALANADENIATINYSVSLDCPESIQREAVENAIPAPDYKSPNKEEWAKSTVQELEKIIALVESGQFQHGSVNFGSTGKNNLDLEKLPKINLCFHYFSYECPEVEVLKSLEKNSNDDHSYKEWSRKCLLGLHNLQMIVLKSNLNKGNPETILDNDKTVYEIRCSCELKCPMSNELQDLLEATNSYGKVSIDDEQWPLVTVNMMQKLQLLFHSGKIAYGEADVNVKQM